MLGKQNGTKVSGQKCGRLSLLIYKKNSCVSTLYVTSGLPEVNRDRICGTIVVCLVSKRKPSLKALESALCISWAVRHDSWWRFVFFFFFKYNEQIKSSESPLSVRMTLVTDERVLTTKLVLGDLFRRIRRKALKKANNLLRKIALNDSARKLNAIIVPHCSVC